MLQFGKLVDIMGQITMPKRRIKYAQIVSILHTYTDRYDL